MRAPSAYSRISLIPPLTRAFFDLSRILLRLFAHPLRLPAHPPPITGGLAHFPPVQLPALPPSGYGHTFKIILLKLIFEVRGT